MSEDANKAVLEGWQRLYVEQWGRANDAETLSESRRLKLIQVCNERDAARKERDEALQKIKGLEVHVAVMAEEIRQREKSLAGWGPLGTPASNKYHESAAAWLDAASSLPRFTYAELHDLRQRARQNLEDAAAGNPHRWVRRRG